MGKILPVLLALIGLGAGAGAGLLLKPPAEEAAGTVTAHAGAHATAATDGSHEAGGEAEPESHAPVAKSASHAAVEAHGDLEYVKLNNQFVIPIVQEERVAAMVVLALSLETAPGNAEAVYAREPRLRDSFLQVLFDHANAGGFDGNFTRTGNLSALRAALLEAAQKTLGPAVSDVLVSDILRQDN